MNISRGKQSNKKIQEILKYSYLNKKFFLKFLKKFVEELIKMIPLQGLREFE